MRLASGATTRCTGRADDQGALVISDSSPITACTFKRSRVQRAVGDQAAHGTVPEPTGTSSAHGIRAAASSRSARLSWMKAIPPSVTGITSSSAR